MATKKTDPTHIKDLKPDMRNARLHSPRNIGMITDALQEVGAARSIVIDEHDTILAGNGTIEAAGDAGITKVQVVEADGDTIIAVRRRNLTEEQKRRLALFDNRAPEAGAEWNPDMLRELQADGTDLSGVFTNEELAALLEEQKAEKVEALKVDRPTDVVWVLVAIPLAQWPKHQAAVEAMQLDAKFSTQVLRPNEPANGGQ